MITIDDIDDDFYLRFENKFLCDVIDNYPTNVKNLSSFLSTPVSNILRMKRTGVIRYFHLRKILTSMFIDKIKIYNELKTMKVGDRGIEIAVRLPLEYSAKLAALIGHVMGDGTINSYGSFEYANKDYVLIEKIKEYVYRVFNCTTYREIKIRKPRGVVFKLIYPAVVGRLLKKSGAPQGKKVIQTFDVPQWIKDSDYKIKSEFLRALFDDDGSVEKHGMITFTNSKRKILRKYHDIYINSILSLLKDFEINGQARFVDRGDDNFKADIRITNLNNLEKFNKMIGFNQKKRHSRLEEILLNPTRKYDKLGEGMIILYNILNETDKALTTEELSESIDRNLSMTRTYLFRLEKQDKIERVFPQRHKVKTLWKCKNRECETAEIDSLYSLPGILSDGPKTASLLSERVNKNTSIIRRNLIKLKKENIVKIIRRDSHGLWWGLV
jgi:predicted transcriptional regulator